MSMPNGDLKTNLRIEVERSASMSFPGYHVIAIKSVTHGALKTIQKLVIKSFLHPEGQGKSDDVLKREANEHADSLGEIFGILDIRHAPSGTSR